MEGERTGAEQAQSRLAKSASRLEPSANQQQDSADRRTELAADRTVLAAERTYSAWVRIGLAALASGIGAKALLQDMVPGWMGQATGSLLVIFAGFCFLAVVWRQMLQVAPPRPDTRRLPEWMLIAVNGFLLLVSLAALIGMWLR